MTHHLQGTLAVVRISRGEKKGKSRKRSQEIITIIIREKYLRMNYGGSSDSGEKQLVSGNGMFHQFKRHTSFTL